MSGIIRPPRHFSFLIAGQVGPSDLTDAELRYALMILKRLIEFLGGAVLPQALAANADAEIKISLVEKEH